MLQKLCMLSLLSALAFFPIVSAGKATPTLKQKIGQMIMIGFPGKTLTAEDPVIKAIKSQQIGGVILFDYDFKTGTFNRNIESPEQLKKLTAELQRYARVPLLIGIDYEGGKVNRLKQNNGFPEALSAEAIAGKGDTAAKNQATQMALTMHEAGINLDFAPVVDVNINPANPVIGKLARSFSSDPQQVSHFARLYSEAFHRQHILCAYKHFPGHGSSSGDSHLGFVDVTHTWQAKELDPYKALLNTPGSCSLAMIAHVIHHGLDEQNYPASLSHKMITGLLRDELNFKGVVITDDLQMKAISSQYGVADAVRLAIHAGVDILVFGNQLVSTPQDPAEIVDLIYKDVMAGKIPHQRIEASWRRIMRLKQQLGSA